MSDAGTEAAPTARGRLFLHVGLPKSGTTFLQALLADNRLNLKAHGLIYPFVRRECMFHAAVELQGQHERWGLDPALIDGTWEQLLAKVRDFRGDGVVSHEILAAASPEVVERVARDTADLELHVVVTARDLARQATAHWQEQVKNGRPWSFAEFSAALHEPVAGEEEELGFWRSQDLVSVLDRWGSAVPADRLHVVTVPRTGADPLELWRRFADALGFDPRGVDLDVEPRTNESLGAAQVALLRQVVEALDGRLGQPHYAHVVKRFFAQGQLARVHSPRPVAPEELRSRLDPVAAGWVEEVRRRGHPVHGDLEELRPRPAGAEGEAPHPDDVTAEQLLAGLPDVLAAMLLEIAQLRTQLDGPRALPPLTHEEPRPPEPTREPLLGGPDGATSPAPPARGWGRLRRRR